MSSEKFAKDIDKYLSNYNVDEVLTTYFLDLSQPFVIRRFYNLMVSFIYRQALKYEMGMIPAETYEVVRLCKKIKDYALSDEEPPLENPTYTEKPVVQKEYYNS